MSLLSPWYFPATDEYREKHEQAEFRVDSIELVPRPTVLPSDMRGWLETFAGPFFHVLPERERADALDEAVHPLRPALCDAEGHWTVDYVRLRFLASQGMNAAGLFGLYFSTHAKQKSAKKF